MASLGQEGQAAGLEQVYSTGSKSVASKEPQTEKQRESVK